MTIQGPVFSQFGQGFEVEGHKLKQNEDKIFLKKICVNIVLFAV